MNPFELPKPTVLKFESLFFQGLSFNEAGIRRVWAGTKLSLTMISIPLPPLPASVSLSLLVS